MKLVFVFLYLHLILNSLFSQGNISVRQNSFRSENEKWGLDNHIWSHTRYKINKNDKPVIDFDAIENWVSLSSDPSDITISSDGNYFAYVVENFKNRKLDTLIISAMNGSPW